MHRTLPLGSALLLLTAACTDGAGETPPPRNEAIGSAGGQLLIGQGPLALTVPAGALDRTVRIALGTGTPSPVPGYYVAGPTYTLAPASTAFAVPATLVLPFDYTNLSTAVDPTTEVRVFQRTADGTVTALVPSNVDIAATCAIGGLGTFWVGAPDVLAPGHLLPLGDGDTYTFAGEIGLQVGRTAAEPNLGGTPVARLVITGGGLTTGYYLDDSGGELALRGAFVEPARQEVWANPVRLLATREAVGSERVGVTAYQGFAPFGATAATDTGIAEVTTTVIGREFLRTPLGWFQTVRVRLAIGFVDSRPAAGDEALELWLAPTVGPVQIRFDGVGEALPITAGTVGGLPVAGTGR